MPPITIRGIQEAQRAMTKAFLAVQPKGKLGRAVQVGTASAHRWSLYYTPVDTGGLKASHRMRIWQRGNRAYGVVDIDPSIRNPERGMRRPYEYGYDLHKEGRIPGKVTGIRAFYEHTVAMQGPSILRNMAATLRRGLP